MFWDTWDFWSDDAETRQIKKYRRKSNYYESKYDELSDSLERINTLLSDVKWNYGLTNSVTMYVTDDVMKYQYAECEESLKQKLESIIDAMECKRDIIAREKNVAYSLYRKYYKLAIR